MRKYIVGVWVDKSGEAKSHVIVGNDWDTDEFRYEMDEWLKDNLTAREYESARVIIG